MTEHFKAPEIIQLSSEQIANLSDAQFKTLVINRIGWIWSKTRWKNEAYAKRDKGTNSDVKETGTQINGVDQKEERNIQPEKNEETRIQKNEERLSNLQDILKCSNIRIIGLPEGEEENKKLKTYLNK